MDTIFSNSGDEDIKVNNNYKRILDSDSEEDFTETSIVSTNDSEKDDDQKRVDKSLDDEINSFDSENNASKKTPEAKGKRKFSKSKFPREVPQRVRHLLYLDYVWTKYFLNYLEISIHFRNKQRN